MNTITPIQYGSTSAAIVGSTSRGSDTPWTEATPAIAMIAAHDPMTSVIAKLRRARFSRNESRTVPVRPQVSNLVGPGFAIVDSLAIEPEAIQVSGPAALQNRSKLIYHRKAF